MKGLNKVQLIGTVGKEPEIRYTAEGKAIANLSLATNEKWKGQDGNWQEKTEWHRVVIFGKLAEVCGQYVHKGTKLYLEGKLQTRKWQDNAGNDRYSTEVVLDFGGNMIMLDSKGQSNQTTEKPPQKQQEQPSFDDDVPF